MKPIIYKQVDDIEGHNSWVELWQGDQHIKISLENAMDSDHLGQAKWSKIKLYMENLIKDRQAKNLTLKEE